MSDEEGQEKLIAGVLHQRRRCSVCKELVWTQSKARDFACEGCVRLDYGNDPEHPGTRGGKRVSRKGSQES